MIVIIPKPGQKGVFGGKFVFILGKKARNPNIIGLSGRRGVIVIIIIPNRTPEQQIVIARGFVPSQLGKTNTLVGQIFGVTIYRVLVVVVIGEGEEKLEIESWLA